MSAQKRGRVRKPAPAINEQAKKEGGRKAALLHYSLMT